MSIIAVFGLPGNGKTSLLTKIAQLNLRGKRFLGIPPHSKVFTNFECQGCYKLDFDSLGVYHYSDALILVDEAMLLCDGRNWKDFGEDLKYFFSNARHFDVDVVMCSQFWKDFDVRIRNLVETYYLLESSSFFPWSYVKPITRFMGVINGNMADIYELGVWWSWKIVYRPTWYRYFDSYTRRDLPALPDLQTWQGFGEQQPPPGIRTRIRAAAAARAERRSGQPPPEQSEDQGSSSESSRPASERGSGQQQREQSPGIRARIRAAAARAAARHQSEDQGSSSESSRPASERGSGQQQREQPPDQSEDQGSRRLP